jgi:hypothetical protein
VLRRQDRLTLRPAALSERALAFVLGVGKERRLVVANLGAAALTARLPRPLAGSWRPAWTSDAFAYGGSGRTANLRGGTLHSPAESTVLFESD